MFKNPIILAVSAIALIAILGGAFYQINQHFSKYEDAIKQSVYDRAAKEYQDRDVKELARQMQILKEQNEVIMKLREETFEELVVSQEKVEKNLTKFRAKLDAATNDQAVDVAIEDTREILPERPQ